MSEEPESNGKVGLTVKIVRDRNKPLTLTKRNSAASFEKLGAGWQPSNGDLEGTKKALDFR